MSEVGHNYVLDQWFTILFNFVSYSGFFFADWVKCYGKQNDKVIIISYSNGKHDICKTKREMFETKI